MTPVPITVGPMQMKKIKLLILVLVVVASTYSTILLGIAQDRHKSATPQSMLVASTISCVSKCPAARNCFLTESMDNPSKVPERMWEHFFSGLRHDLNIGKISTEDVIEKFLYTASPRHELCARFPLKPIPIVLETQASLCMLGSHLTGNKGTICENSVRGMSSWTPDPHVRDIITTALFACSFRDQPDDCFAVDVGSNIGAHTLVMLQLGARVVSIEPQMDFCVASRLSAAALGYANRSVVVCGGLAPFETTPASGMLDVGKDNWRYEGKLTDMPYQLSAVPLVSLERLVRNQRKINFLKIDTDSIDCSVLQQAIRMIDRGIIIKAIILESWDNSCKADNLMGSQILKLARLGYTVYRTLVYERAFDDHHRDYENDFKTVTLPKGWIEEFHVGFNFVLWRADTDVLSDEELKTHPLNYGPWQYLFTKGIDVVQAGYKAKDL
jgi:FkbM family methyltransferase